MSEHLPLYTFIQSQKNLEDFLEMYEPEKLMIPPDKPLTRFQPRNTRICRFCAQPAGLKKFKKEAHVIPQFLGNKYLVSDFECDDCNKLFSNYENDLANWLGITRTVLGTVGKGGIPTFKSPKEGVTARLVDFFNDKATQISTPNSGSEAIHVDLETGKTVIKYRKSTYTPINVYKVLLKVALSMIASDEIEQYRSAFKFLFDDRENYWFKEFAQVMCHHLPMDHRFIKPIGVMYKKQDQSIKRPQHVFLLYYATYIFSFPMPFSQVDVKNGHYKDHVMDILYPPPIVFSEPHKLSIHHSRRVDLSGYKKVKDEEEAISFEVKPEHLKNLMAFDPKTGISKPSILNPSEITGIYFVPQGTKIDMTGKVSKDGTE